MCAIVAPFALPRSLSSLSAARIRPTMVKQHRTSPRITAEKLGCHLRVSEALTGAGLMTMECGDRRTPGDLQSRKLEVCGLGANKYKLGSGASDGAWARFCCE